MKTYYQYIKRNGDSLFFYINGSQNIKKQFKYVSFLADIEKAGNFENIDGGLYEGSNSTPARNYSLTKKTSYVKDASIYDAIESDENLIECDFIDYCDGKLRAREDLNNKEKFAICEAIINNKAWDGEYNTPQELFEIYKDQNDLADLWFGMAEKEREYNYRINSKKLIWREE